MSRHGGKVVYINLSNANHRALAEYANSQGKSLATYTELIIRKFIEVKCPPKVGEQQPEQVK